MTKPAYNYPYVAEYRSIDYGWVVSDYHYHSEMLIAGVTERFYKGNKYELSQSALEDIVRKQQQEQ
ncbi:hypothetical protein LCGC14_1732690 [marine sediment metagenome]|uniref:Uncharacterized protein n=1 Tax=marine sediment metagenome TaxID=412755 RepID=A0A0F9JPG9_9ZZZZ